MALVLHLKNAPVHSKFNCYLVRQHISQRWGYSIPKQSEQVEL